MKDMSDPQVRQEYDKKIFDGARDLAVTFKGNPLNMKVYLLAVLGIPTSQVDAVIEAMESPEYEEISYRGEMVDEGVIEALKDCLRPLHGF